MYDNSSIDEDLKETLIELQSGIKSQIFPERTGLNDYQDSLLVEPISGPEILIISKDGEISVYSDSPELIRKVTLWQQDEATPADIVDISIVPVVGLDGSSNIWNMDISRALEEGTPFVDFLEDFITANSTSKVL